MGKILFTKNVDFFLIMLIIFYTITVFINLALQDITKDTTNEAINKIMTILLYIEITILVVFSIEIILKTYAQGILVKNM